tara:strand:- start:1560 stop:2036 length:477 start_codon:yes stop_codon:yes gene_type:complete
MGPASKWVIGLLMISLFFIGIAGFIGEFETNYDMDTGSQFVNITAAFEDTSFAGDITVEGTSAIGGWETDEDSKSGVLGWALSWPGQILRTFAAVFTSFSNVGPVATDMLSETASATGLSSQGGEGGSEGALIVGILGTIIGLAIIFAITKLMTGRDV